MHIFSLTTSKFYYNTIFQVFSNFVQNWMHGHHFKFSQTNLLWNILNSIQAGSSPISTHKKASQPAIDNRMGNTSNTDTSTLIHIRLKPVVMTNAMKNATTNDFPGHEDNPIKGYYRAGEESAINTLKCHIITGGWVNWV